MAGTSIQMSVNERSNLHTENASINTCSTAAHAVQAISTHPDASRRTSGTTVHGRGTKGKLRGRRGRRPGCAAKTQPSARP
eukprot:9544701-Alexandrium_andersonii.AAC.1